MSWLVSPSTNEATTDGAAYFKCFDVLGKNGISHMKKTLLLVVALHLSIALPPLCAQDIQTKGSLSGTIVDVNGAVIQNARVTISFQKTIHRVVATNNDGVFDAQNLTPGIYRLAAEQTRFKTNTVSHVQVFV